MTAVNGIADIDHVMCQVTDTEQAQAVFERLGFATTPRSSIADGGVANRLVILTPKGPGVANFIELMAIEDRDRLEPAMAQVLSGSQGIKSLVNNLEDADTARAAQLAAGFAMLEVWPKQRIWQLPSGEELLVAFRVLLPEPGQVPLMFNGVQYRTLQHYLRPEFQQHPNGALRWVAVGAVIDDADFDSTVAIYERLYGSTAVRGAGQAIVTVRDTSLTLMTPDVLAGAYGAVEVSGFDPPDYCSVSVAVANLPRAAALLADAGVRYVQLTDSLVVEPADACGMVLEFVASAA